MDKLKFDIGNDSIGWAYLKLSRTEKRTLRKLNQRKIKIEAYQNSKHLSFNTKRFFYKDIRITSLLIITTLSFILAFIMPEFWQLWINLGVGSLLALITHSK